MKQFIKASNNDGNCFQYICTTFPGCSNEKLKGGVFNGPQIRTLIKDARFVNSMNKIESSAWNSFVEIVQIFGGGVCVNNFTNQYKTS